jgi:short-subunit dehydrogenase
MGNFKGLPGLGKIGEAANLAGLPQAWRKPPMARVLRGRNLLITGASRGIGRGVAKLAAAEGARVALAARSAGELESLVAELKQAGAEAWAFPTDLTQREERWRLVEQAASALGGIDVLINNAGLASVGAFASSTEDVLRRLMEINFFAPAELTRMCLPYLEKGHQPAVVNVGSVCGRSGIPGLSEHSASKFALTGLTEALRAEFVRYDVDVLLVLPGLTQTDDLGKHLLRDDIKRYGLDFAGAQPPEAVSKAVIDALKKNRPETTVGRQAWWVAFGQRASPLVMNLILAAKVRGA